jgi:hypothetical protein
VVVIEAGRMLVDRGPGRRFWELAVRALPALGVLGSVLPALVLGLRSLGLGLQDASLAHQRAPLPQGSRRRRSTTLF